MEQNFITLKEYAKKYKISLFQAIKIFNSKKLRVKEIDGIKYIEDRDYKDNSSQNNSSKKLSLEEKITLLERRVEKLEEIIKKLI
ncbi:MAG: hypothetical protein GXO02_01685 [Epsilonproteobacteria bacterium]|nr:hypothetical protein [Campylobacterota bacterium]